MATTIHDPLNARAQSGVVNDSNDPDPEVAERARGPRRYSAKYKAQVPRSTSVSTRPPRARCCDARACTRR
jgi:hypothetical protein